MRKIYLSGISYSSNLITYTPMIYKGVKKRRYNNIGFRLFGGGL